MIKYLQIIFSILLISSCTFEPDGLNYVEIEKPTDTHPMEVTLSIDRDSIYIYRSTNFSYKINTNGKKLNAAVVKYLDNEIVMTANAENFSFYIDKPNTDNTNKWFDLTIDFYVSTGSGSITDVVKMENYLMSKTWKIQFVDLQNAKLNTGHKIHPDGYLEVYIIKPSYLEGKFTCDNFGIPIPHSRNSGDTLFFADKSYVYGTERYQMTFKFDDNQNYNWYNWSFTVNYPEIEFKAEAYGPDSCKVSWGNSPFKLYYNLNNNLYSGFDKAYIVPIMVNEKKSFNLKINSPNYVNETYSREYKTTEFIQGTQTYYNMCYSVDKDIFFISSNESLPYISSSGIPIPKSENHAQYNSKVNIYCSPNGKYIAGHSYLNIYIYNENLTLTKKIPDIGLDYSYRPYFAVTNDGAFTYQHRNTLHLRNVSESTDWESFSFKTDLDSIYTNIYLSVIANSVDGKYICVRGLNGLKIYDVSDHQTARVVYTHPDKSVQRLVAHPTDPGLIYALVNDKLQLRTCPGFELVKTIDIELSDYRIYTIDPYSGILMMWKNDDLYFYDPDTGRKLLQLKSNQIWRQQALLVRNQLKMANNTIDLTSSLVK